MTNSPLSSLIPHQGSMCLLERVIEWDEQSIRLATASHRSADNPLRANGRLRAVHLCEYGAQAMAVHGALKAQASGGQAPPGMLVSLRAVSFDCDYMDALPGELLIDARCLHADGSSQQYAFSVLHAGSTLATGRAAVVLRR
jgi:predicted hotdog family 3-hydroxylacyl-ACP dehydratase